MNHMQDPTICISPPPVQETKQEIKSVIQSIIQSIEETKQNQAPLVPSAEAVKQAAASKFVRCIKDAVYSSSTWKLNAAIKAIRLKRSPIDSIDQYGINSLCYAVSLNNSVLVDLLIQSGADVNFKSQTDRCWSVLHFAVFYKHPDAVAKLIDAGAVLQKCDDERYRCNPLEMAESFNKRYIKRDLRIELIEILETADVRVEPKK
jgi:hypothetical protein